MCLGVPGKVVDTVEEDGIVMGRVEFGGVIRKVCLAHVPDVRPGEYVLVHVGFALTKLDEAEAARVLAMLAELAAASELEPEPDPAEPA
jgi:hydrogenase expression/formation protein HypC